VDFVHNGEDALDYAQAAEYDGIILDWMMPAPDGVEVLRRLRAKRKKQAYAECAGRIQVFYRSYIQQWKFFYCGCIPLFRRD
jgi:CheY-like chemotaxis protein